MGSNLVNVWALFAHISIYTSFKPCIAIYVSLHKKNKKKLAPTGHEPWYAMVDLVQNIGRGGKF